MSQQHAVIDRDGDESLAARYIGIGLMLGTLLGVITGNLVLGMCLGLVLGAGVGASAERQVRSQEPFPPSPAPPPDDVAGDW